MCLEGRGILPSLISRLMLFRLVIGVNLNTPRFVGVVLQRLLNQRLKLFGFGLFLGLLSCHIRVRGIWFGVLCYKETNKIRYLDAFEDYIAIQTRPHTFASASGWSSDTRR